MIESLKIYASDGYWRHILADMGANVVESADGADIDFDEIDIKIPVSVDDLKKIILNSLNNQDVISDIFGKFVVLPTLQHKIILSLYKKPDMTMRELKDVLGISPDVSSHAVENAIYQLRKNYGRDLILNMDGKYKIGHI